MFCHADQFVVSKVELFVSLQPSDVTIVKSMKNPPSGVKLVMSAVCVMKDIKPDKIADPAGTGKKVGLWKNITLTKLIITTHFIVSYSNILMNHMFT